MMNITLPELSLVVLIGPSGSGKSTFASKHFDRFETISSDFCRGLVSNDENDQTISSQAFHVLHNILENRLTLGKLSVVDATNVRPDDRKTLIQLARRYHVLPVAIVFDMPDQVCFDRNELRPDRNFGSHVVRNQRRDMKRYQRNLRREGFRHIYTFKNVAEVDSAIIDRQPLWNNKKHFRGPFDIIGDVHGCCTELLELLDKLGYQIKYSDGEQIFPYHVNHPENRLAVFVGDLNDRGPRVVDTYKLVMSMCKDGVAHCVPGNHDIKLLKFLRGKKVQVKHGLQQSIDELENESEEFKKELTLFIDSLISHHVYDDGKLVVSHAGLKENMQGRGSGRVRDFCLYGETTGETDEFGLPIRYEWAVDYKGSAQVVYGHTPVPEAEWLNNTINIDTGCVFGGKLTALQYPENRIISVPSKKVYAEPAKPFLETNSSIFSQQQIVDDQLDLSDVFGKQIISTRYQRNIIIREENSAAALEVISRFAANPKWLIYLPPTMSPCETSDRDDYLEHPDQAFKYFQNQGVSKVICQQKHMGSRAVVIVCKDNDVVKNRFGISEDGIGIIYTRTGRRFFDDYSTEQFILEDIKNAIDHANLWEELQSDWVCMDCELMPWSAKAQQLLEWQYAPVGTSGNLSLTSAVDVLHQTTNRLQIDHELVEEFSNRKKCIELYTDAYRQYCWDVQSLHDIRIAPFHILASENEVHTNKEHDWHMNWSEKLGEYEGKIVMNTNHFIVDVSNDNDRENGVNWWQKIVQSGGEGMVVKPMSFIHRGEKGMVQPAIKCRGPEYLRIIYGPEYSLPKNIKRLRTRRLGRKRNLATREFCLGIESLDRFVNKEPLRRVHQCVFGVLALESEPVDPRL